MHITHLETTLLRLPLSRPVNGTLDVERGRQASLSVVLVHVHAENGLQGLGFATSLEGAGRALRCLVEDDLGPLLQGENPWESERIAVKMARRLQGIGRLGLVQQAYSAIDLALWDLKGKDANLPLYKLLGGSREAAPAFVGDCGWLWMSAEEMLDAVRPYLDQGLKGFLLHIGDEDPEADAERLTRVREALGEQTWLGVNAEQRYDHAMALYMGRFLDEEIAPDWFEEPLGCEDLPGHVRLAKRLEAPVAAGAALYSRDEFHEFLKRQALDILRPDPQRLGGVSACVKVLALAETYRRPAVIHGPPEVAIHLACGHPTVRMVEFSSWLAPLFEKPLTFDEGMLRPPKLPGLGLKVRAAALEEFKADR